MVSLDSMNPAVCLYQGHDRGGKLLKSYLPPGLRDGRDQERHKIT